MTPRRQDGDLEASASNSDGGLRYGGRWFSAATALQGDRGAHRPRRVLTCVAAAVRRPQRVAALVVVLLRTRSVGVVVSESVAGRALREHFNERVFHIFPKNRLCRGVLVLPEHRSDYLRGQRRRALRRKLRKAATAGITCEVIDEGSRAVEAIEAITRTRQVGPLAAADLSYLQSSLARPEVTLLLAHDERGRPRAAAAAVIDEVACLIEWATSNSHLARYALHDHLVDVLIARGVRYLVASGEGPFGALGFTTNVQEYQHLLGYELRHLRPVLARASTSRGHRHAGRLRPHGVSPRILVRCGRSLPRELVEAPTRNDSASQGGDIAPTSVVQEPM